MKKYKKLPVVIEAARFDGYNADVVMQWINSSTGHCTAFMTLNDDARVILIKTLEGVMTASVGDWIIKGVQGEFYPCKSDIFDQTYEEVL